MPTTTKDIVVNARIDSETLRQLDELGREMQRTRSFLIAQAVREFVEREYAALSAIREGEEDIEAGRYLAGDEARAWFEDLKSGCKRRAPEFNRGGRKR